MIDHPRFEGRDVQRADRLRGEATARRKRDRRRDPRVGMSGGSYGGGVQFLAAARDPRIDAITPTIAWHDLLEPLSARVGRRRAGTWR